MKRKKRVFLVALATAVVFIVASCATAPASGSTFVQAQPTVDPASEFAGNARRTAPEGAIVGIGSASHANEGLARASAEARARAEVTRQIDSVTRTMINDVIIGSEQEPAVIQFTESVTQTLAARRLQGALIVDEARFGNRQLMVVRISRGDIETEIRSAAQAHAALAPHVNAGLWSIDRMDEALRENNMAPPVVRDFD